jgi:hypothetical protein
MGEEVPVEDINRAHLYHLTPKTTREQSAIGGLANHDGINRTIRSGQSSCHYFRLQRLLQCRTVRNRSTRRLRLRLRLLQPSHQPAQARAPTSRPKTSLPLFSPFSPILRALPCPAVLYLTVSSLTHSLPLTYYYGCCRALELTPLRSPILSPGIPTLHHRCRAQPTSTPPSPPPAHCGAVTHWHPTTLHTPTPDLAASTCQFESTRDRLHRP